MTEQEKLRLTDLLNYRRDLWFFAWIIGLIASISSIVLLALSGWFLTAAAAAGIINLATAYVFNYLMPAGFIRFAAISRTVGRYAERLASHYAVLTLLADLRSKTFARVMSHNKSSSIEQMQKLTSDIDQLDALPVKFLLPCLWTLSLFLIISVLLFTAFGVFYALFVLLFIFIAAAIIPYRAILQVLTIDENHSILAEQRRIHLIRPLATISALLQWGQWSRFAEIFSKSDSKYSINFLIQQKISGKTVLLQQIFLAISSILVLIFGAILLDKEEITVAMLLAVLLTVYAYAETALALGAQINAYGLSFAACARINNMLEDGKKNSVTAEINKDENYYKNFDKSKKLALRVENITAKYETAINAAENISFEIKTGEILLITGASGAGKSSLLSALAGELKINKGSIFLNNEEYKPEAAIKDGIVGFLAQDIDIFDLSLKENLTLGKKDIREEKIWEILEAVNLSKWVKNQPEGLNTQLGEYAAAISGGQARRIALARLLLNDYPILILDEPFAGLDIDSQIKISKYLENKNIILIVVNHRNNYWNKARVLNISSNSSI
ncbi:MAG: ATP-binding cassette domain-containing protein [Cardiobacteriaceae bacterium]|nr:ATP-binding cassette domain-containing protein [Cardiobacteriaceae bacterium]